jgi:hypothetical protein
MIPAKKKKLLVAAVEPLLVKFFVALGSGLRRWWGCIFFLDGGF